jgi:hypothetical protein
MPFFLAAKPLLASLEELGSMALVRVTGGDKA